MLGPARHTATAPNRLSIVALAVVRLFAGSVAIESALVVLHRFDTNGASPAGDPEMATMVREEVESLTRRMDATAERLKVLLLPRDPLDDRNIMLEIRAGTGGEEAALWAADLVRMCAPRTVADGGKAALCHTVPEGRPAALVSVPQRTGRFRGKMLVSSVCRYQMYAVTQSWKVSLVNESAAEKGGYRECILQVQSSLMLAAMCGVQPYFEPLQSAFA